METAVGVVDVKSSPVYFHVQRTSTYNVTGTTIPFHIERLNVGGGMNITSGIFTAPKSGIYFFSFNGLTDRPANYLDAELYQNSNLIARAHGHDFDGYWTATLSATLNLKSGDQISLRLVQGQLQNNSLHHTNFNGMLLQEEMLS